MATNKPTMLTTGEVRISYEHLLKPYANQPNAEPKYSATLLIPKSDIATKQRIDAAIQAAIQEGPGSKWGGVRPPQIPIPIHDGDGVRPSDGSPFGPECKGHWVMTASSKNKPDIVDLNLNPILDPTQIYSGMYARVNINFFPYSNAGKKGIGCGLGPVQKIRDGEPLGGYVSAEEAFADSQGFASAYQPPAPGYSQPQYQQPYPAAPAQPQQPQYAAPQAPAYQQPQYSAPQQPQAQPPWHTPAQPAQPAQVPGTVDPITGRPLAAVPGGIYGVGNNGR